MPTDAQALQVGDRLLVGGLYRCALRYVGPLEGETGKWAGVEWDSPSRGKHRGTHGGREYFTCQQPEPARPASFVRLPKLASSCQRGCSLLEAVHAKYVVGVERGCGRPSGVELRGETAAQLHVSDLQAQEVLSVSGQHVSHIVRTPWLGWGGFVGEGSGMVVDEEWGTGAHAAEL